MFLSGLWRVNSAHTGTIFKEKMYKLETKGDKSSCFLSP